MDKGNYGGIPYPCNWFSGAVGLNKVVEKGEKDYAANYCKK